MSEPHWITPFQAMSMQGEQLAIFGPGLQLRDEGLLQSALTRPHDKWAHGTTDLAELAAAYAFGTCRNMPFIAGNKRAAFVCMVVFLRKNDVIFAPPEALATAAMIALAAGDIDEPGFARWIRDYWPKG